MKLLLQKKHLGFWLAISMIAIPTAGFANCNLISKNVKGKFTEDKQLQTLFDDLDSGLKTRDAKILRPLFHPRLQKSYSTEKIRGFLRSFDLRYGKKAHYSHYRTWGLKTDNGNPGAIECNGGDFKIFPTYGYNEQVLMWFNVVGFKELGKLTFVIVKHKDVWQIATMHIQQWTLKGKTAEDWVKLAENKKSSPVESYLYYDIAAKLLETDSPIQFSGKTFLRETATAAQNDDQIAQLLLNKDKAFVNPEVFAALDAAKHAKTPALKSVKMKKLDEILKKHKLEQYKNDDVTATIDAIAKTEPPYRVEKISSYFTKYGPAMMAFLRFNRALERQEREDNCLEAAKELYPLSNKLKGLEGVYCKFHYPQHSLEEPNKLRGIFVRKRQITTASNSSKIDKKN